jgi:hypothetical protein
VSVRDSAAERPQEASSGPIEAGSSPRAAGHDSGRQARVRRQAGYLDSPNLGSRISVKIDDDAITGRLRGIEHGADSVEIRAYGRAEPEAEVTGPRWVELSLAPWDVTIRIPAWRHVELLGGDGS